MNDRTPDATRAMRRMATEVHAARHQADLAHAAAEAVRKETIRTGRLAEAALVAAVVALLCCVALTCVLERITNV